MKNIAVIGAGYWGKNLVRNYHELGALHTVCDTNLSALESFGKTYQDIGTTDDFQKVLDNADIQALVIALPAEKHFEYSRKGLECGKDIYVEKPLSLDVGQAQQLISLAEKDGRVLMVGHILRYHPAFIKLKELVDKGELGRIQYVYSNRLSLGKIRREENSLWSFAPHDISMILALCNEEPDMVSAVGFSYLHKELADVTTTHLSFPSGINGHIFVSWLHPFKEQKLVVVADKKMAVFEDTQPWEKKITLYSHNIKWQSGVPVPEKADPEYVPVEPSEPLKAECVHFLTCIKNRTAPVTDGNEGYRVLKVLDQAQKSLEKGRGKKPVPSVREKSLPYFAHPTAFVDEPCTIGEGTKIWHFAHVMKNARIGKKCIIGQNVNIANDVVIGNNVKIQNNVSIYTGTTVEDDVFLGPSCVLTNVTNPRSQVNRHSLYETTIIKRGATVGANATIVCGINLGRYSFIAAGAVVAKNVPDYAMMVGVPARRAGWMSRHGIKLQDPDSDGVMTCPESGLRYKEVEPGVIKCLDLDEETPLPDEMSKGTIAYDEFKKMPASETA
jgi:UDP-2-acetamido-3-amino-2,3-dideoxy-glucuronate N-acetyltransferase